MSNAIISINVFYKTSETHPMNDDEFRSIFNEFLGAPFWRRGWGQIGTKGRRERG